MTPRQTPNHPASDPQALSAGAKRFPALALASSGILLLAVAAGAQPGAMGTKFPLLALLGLCELGVLINLAGAYLALRTARAQDFRLSALLLLGASLTASAVFLWLGFWLWPL
ncbi:hypothetical protein [Thiorhodovibrio frisius]|uniref:Uncharacterized protein n=1 Tax=Thiorhodovibrio frisius TaxID=631362 RepID=H8Z356_9GAMM|nr:hypothetical protein [Thiorhodovibrio frisius]EIC21764.1 hypothetical protein Thi970DRAFT_01993 [Thiorhodovibrio frisius]WPL21730.1 hypothetical protein Thiofri_01863 [Thiorhodovibrio frisius]